MTNYDVARIMREIAELLEIKGENQFKIRSYYRVSQTLETLPDDVNRINAEDKLQTIPGVGEGIAKKIKELLDTGKLRYYEELKSDVPAGLLDILSIPDVGPKTARLVYEELGIKTVDELEKAAREQKIRNLFRMGARTEENILKGIEFFRRKSERLPLGKALPIAENVIELLRKKTGVERIECAGSLRRMKETIKDIDMLVISRKPDEVMEAFTSMPDVREVLAHGQTKSSVVFGEGRVQMDLRVVEPESFGAALQYFTGSKQHNIKLRERAQKKHLKINEYGVFNVKGKTEKRVGGADEEEIYRNLGLPWIPPELREDTGEVEAAEEGKLPHLVERSDIKGDFHVHTRWSDGAHTIEEMARAAIALGYSFIAICDHTKSLGIARGLDEETILKQKKEIERLNKKLAPFRILAGTEVDIKSDGSLDLPDKVLAQLDVVVASIHSGLKDSAEAMTARIVKALQNPHVDILGHPTGRLLGERDAYQVDIEKVFDAAKKEGKALELNALPDRLDLNDVMARRAKNLGVRIAISTDAHATHHLELLFKYGIPTARRAWLETADLFAPT